MADTPKSDTPNENRAQIFKPAGPGGSYAKAGAGGVSIEKGKLLPMKKKPNADTPPPPSPQNNIQDDAPVAKPVASKPAQASSPPPKKQSAKAQSKQAASETMSSMMSDMRKLAEKRGGYLTLDDLDNMQGELQARADQLAVTLEKSFEDYSKDKEKSEWDKKRNYDFQRLIVKKFAVLFDSDGKGGPALISRRMLPGFNMALEMITGPENIEHYRDQCRLIIATLKNSHPGDFEGALAYQSAEAEEIIMDVLVQVAEAFENFDKRSTWFIELINAHLNPQEDPLAKDVHWEMNGESFKVLLVTLLGDLTRELSNAERRARLIKRHGSASCSAAIKVIRRLMA